MAVNTTLEISKLNKIIQQLELKNQSINTALLDTTKSVILLKRAIRQIHLKLDNGYYNDSDIEAIVIIINEVLIKTKVQI